MAISLWGRAARLLETFASHSSASRTVTYFGNVAQGSELGCDAAPALTSKTAGRTRGSYRRLTSTGRPLPQMQAGRLAEPLILPHPATLVEEDLRLLFDDIRKELESQFELQEIAKYYFDGQGKAVRPLITVLMSRAINTHLHDEDRLLDSQRDVAMAAEMIHTASLVHDDVLDVSDTRRGKASINSIHGQRKAVMTGDFILSATYTMISRRCCPDAIIAMGEILMNLIHGEFLQMGSKESEDERFAHYLKKTFLKTASLIAYSCKTAAILSGADDSLQEVAFQYGRNVGIAFQLVDDLLDFVSSSSTMGKPTAADLKLGLATAPVLFAAGQFPELNPMIMRRFQEPGDVQKAFELVHKSDGLEQTQFLARQHCQEAIKVISTLKPSEEQKALITITDKVLNRTK
ncbi:all trans-polyprenyl-diphosphate synthase PDSS1-like [Portunus trituberculatus]|uniref:all trans-polyprenyl-diphosphate synthase PDSS1-like n=1 Tax=Portunus trituberculatus TaxID=210409 RepID=UPI001E1CDEF3|nr:all trans-polyprenyl-diphosphate synthase PDSS1-like [Portunus trituberculatus]